MARRVIGRIMADLDNGEADLVMAPIYKELDPLLQSDLMKDAMQDATNIYNEAVEGAFGPDGYFEKIVAEMKAKGK